MLTQPPTLSIEVDFKVSGDVFNFFEKNSYYWREGNGSVTFDADLQLPHFKLESMELKSTVAQTKTGNNQPLGINQVSIYFIFLSGDYDRLNAKFTVKRNLGSFLYR